MNTEMSQKQSEYEAAVDDSKVAGQGFSLLWQILQFFSHLRNNSQLPNYN